MDDSPAGVAAFSTPPHPTPPMWEERRREKEEEKEEPLGSGEEPSSEVDEADWAAASPALLRVFVDTAKGEAAATREVLRAVDELTREREGRHQPTAAALLASKEAYFALQQQASQLALRVQEAEERGERLLHENLVLSTELAEERGRLAAAVDLARARGRAPRTTPRPNPERVGRERLDAASAGAANTLSLRARTTSARAAAKAREGEGEGGGDDDDDLELMAALRAPEAPRAAHVLALTEEVQALRLLLDEQRELYERARAKEAAEGLARHRADLAQARSTLLHVDHLEALHEAGLRELVGCRHRAGRRIRGLQVRLQQSRRAAREAVDAAAAARAREARALREELRRVEGRYAPVVRSLGADLEAHRRGVRVERRGHAEAARAKDEEIARLTAAVRRERALRRRAEERHGLEMAGVRSELDLMRQALRQMEKKVFFRRALEEVAIAADGQANAEYYFRYQ